MIRVRLPLAVLLSLLLLGAQQAAFAHMIGHIGPAVGIVTTVHEDDTGHNEALTLSHVCTTCVSAAALVAAAPFGVSPRLTFFGAVDVPPVVVRGDASVVSTQSYLARAPPAAL
jgi:hypothetical protein